MFKKEKNSSTLFNFSHFSLILIKSFVYTLIKNKIFSVYEKKAMYALLDFGVCVSIYIRVMVVVVCLLLYTAVLYFILWSVKCEYKFLSTHFT